MATRGYIVLEKNDHVKWILCGYDSYPSHLGKILLESYNDESVIEKLINLGDLNSIGSNLENCTSYDIDSADMLVKTAPSLGEVIIRSKYIDYTYVFRNNKWYYSKWDYAEFNELNREVIAADK